MNLKNIIAFGFLGLTGSFLVGAGECFLHFSPTGYSGETEYSFLKNISDWRIPWGHFLSVLPLPLYYLGYWHLYLILKEKNVTIARVFFLLSVYMLTLAHVWIGSRSILIKIVHLNSTNLNLDSLIQDYEFFYETLINIVRVGIFISSIIYIWIVWKGNSILPRWMIFFNPILLIISSFLLYLIFPHFGGMLAPIAMNFAHIILFSLTTVLSFKFKKIQDKFSILEVVKDKSI